MKISIREALFSGEEVENWTPPKSNWILIKPAREESWTPEAKNLKAYSKDDYVTTDYEVRLFDDNTMRSLRGDTFSGTLGSDYWYCELPDGATIMMIADSPTLRDDLETIQEAVVEAYEPNNFIGKKIKFK